MKAKDVLEVWTGWDSPDIFEIRETTPKRKIISRHFMCGAELIKSPFGISIHVPTRGTTAKIAKNYSIKSNFSMLFFDISQ